MDFLLHIAAVLVARAAFSGLLQPVSAAGKGYDYSATTECLKTPWKAAYGGGIIINPEIREAAKGWKAFGSAKLRTRRDETGNMFIVASGRQNSHDSPSQSFRVYKDTHYAFSAWVQIAGDGAYSDGVIVSAEYNIGGNGTNADRAAAVTAFKGCWSMLKGGFTVHDASSSSMATLYFESNVTGIELWVDSVAVRPFSVQEWRQHIQDSLSKLNRGASFPFGCSLSANVARNERYQDWFAARFNVATFANEMKWYATEATQGNESYSDADAMLAFCKSRGIKVRGHAVLWDDPKYAQPWLKSLATQQQFQEAVSRRIQSVVSRYKGDLISWDVNNEMLHYSLFEDRLGGANASAALHEAVAGIDPAAVLFVNEFNTVEDPYDATALPDRLARTLRRLPGRPGLGLQAHFGRLLPPNLPRVRAVLDLLASTSAPLWISEMDLVLPPSSSSAHAPRMLLLYLEQLLRETYAHPAVQGIVLWAAYDPQSQSQSQPGGFCHGMCLVDHEFGNTPFGDVVDGLLREWGRLPLPLPLPLPLT